MPAVQCEDPVRIPFTTWSYKPDASQLEAVYRCFPSYKYINGTTEMLCLENGQWDVTADLRCEGMTAPISLSGRHEVEGAF